MTFHETGLELKSSMKEHNKLEQNTGTETRYAKFDYF